jgi:outer membrane protein insertion porin family
VTRWWRLAAGAALFVAIRPVVAQEVTCDPGDREVRRVLFTGNQTFRDDELANRILTTQDSWARRHLNIIGQRYCLDSLAVRQDSLRLIVFYRQHGFSDVSVGSSITLEGDDAAQVRFTIAEGRATVVDSLTIAGLDSLPERSRLVRGLPLRKGDRFDQLVVSSMRDTLVRRLRDRGYPIADVLRDFDTDTAQHTARVAFQVMPGPRMRIGGIAIHVERLHAPGSGPRDSVHTTLKPEAVRAVLGVREGQLYNESNLETVQRGLYLSQAFQNVGIQIDSGSLTDPADSLVSIDVRLLEADLHAARVAVGWGSLDCLRTQGSFSNYALLGRLRRLDLNGRVSKFGLCTSTVRGDPLSDTLNYYAAATISQAALFRLPYVPSLTVYSERRSEFEAFLRDTPFGLIGSVTQDANGTFPKIYSYQLEYGRTVAQAAFFCGVFNVCEDAARERLERQTRSAVLGWTGTRNESNSIVSPTRGSVMRLEVRHSSSLVGSSPDVAFNRLVVDASLYRPAFGGALALRFRYGVVLGQRLSFSGSPNFVPLEQRLYAGGPTTVRGYRQNELGPSIYIPEKIDTIPIPGNDTLVFMQAVPDKTSQLVVPTGGDNAVVANVELRLPSFVLPDVLQLAMFVDGGQVWNRGRKGTGINFQNFRVTPGVGVRYFSSIGPLRVDVGYNPYARPSGPAYYNPLATGSYSTSGDVRLICVSPGNTLRVRLGDETTPPRQIDQTDCPATYAPAAKRSFLSRLTFQFSIGQPF